MVEPSNRAEARHPMAVVCRRTGLKPDLVRAWERRYGAVQPARSESRRRLYSEQDIDRLRLLRRVTEQGHPIRLIARLAEAELEELLEASRAAWAPPVAPSPDEPELAEIFEQCMSAAQSFDGTALARGLERATVLLGRRDWIERFVVPLLQRAGELWHQGQLRPAQEHLLTSQLRTAVGQLLQGYQLPGWAPRIVVTTPAGQSHELGALLVAATAAGEGWKAVFLGSDLPAAEIALAAEKLHARAVALSVTFSEALDALGQEIAELRRRLDPQVELVVGGRLAAELTRGLELDSVRTPADLAAFRTLLATLSSP